MRQEKLSFCLMETRLKQSEGDVKLQKQIAVINKYGSFRPSSVIIVTLKPVAPVHVPMLNPIFHGPGHM